MNSLVIIVTLFLTVYGIFHLYLLIKARKAFYLEGLGYFLLFTVLVFLLIAPINAHILERQGHSILALLMAWVGNLWMGMIFIFVWLSLPLDAYHLFMVLMQRLSNGDLTHLMLSRRQRFVLSALLTLVILGYGAYEAQNLQVNAITLRSPKLPADRQRIRVVQISDLHLGPMMFQARVKPIVEAVAAAKPDILVSTGDLLDGRIPDMVEIQQMLNAVKAPMGKFAVTGNHEYYAGLDLAATFTKAAGFTLLQNKSVVLDNGLAVVGVDDPAGGALDSSIEQTLLSGLPPGKFTLLLKHRPRAAPQSSALFDLQLSGHTHHGQMLPLGLLVRLRYPLDHGLLTFPEGSRIYTSSGAGTWGPPFRLMARPEITVIDLLPGAAVEQKTTGTNPASTGRKK